MESNIDDEWKTVVNNKKIKSYNKVIKQKTLEEINNLILEVLLKYKPYSIYGNQRTVDNRSARRLFGGTDQLHNEMVNSQYK
jgi:hypothetical protein